MSGETTTEAVGIKELTEVLEGLKVIGVLGGKVFADGRVGADDLSHLITLASDFGKLADAVSGIGEVGKEVKDLDQAEILLLVNKVFEIVSAVKAELKAA